MIAKPIKIKKKSIAFVFYDIIIQTPKVKLHWYDTKSKVISNKYYKINYMVNFLTHRNDKNTISNILGSSVNTYDKIKFEVSENSPSHINKWLKTGRTKKLILKK